MSPASSTASRIVAVCVCSSASLPLDARRDASMFPCSALCACARRLSSDRDLLRVALLAGAESLECLQCGGLVSEVLKMPACGHASAESPTPSPSPSESHASPSRSRSKSSWPALLTSGQLSPAWGAGGDGCPPVPPPDPLKVSVRVPESRAIRPRVRGSPTAHLPSPHLLLYPDLPVAGDLALAYSRSAAQKAPMTGRVLEFDSDADDVGQVDAVRKPNGWATSVPSL